jgi:O-antigen ligase
MAIVALGSVAVFAFFAILVRVGPAALMARFAAADLALADRVTIWRETLPVIRDFWLTGAGVGTYETAMAVYQRSSPGVLFNQAHNHYLQVAAEGGVLVGVPVALALGAFARLTWSRLVADRSGMFWIRAGAASGLAGVAVQSLWETGLTTPANAALAAVLAAIAIHVPARFGPPGVR